MFKSTGATPSAQKKGSNPVPYGTEVHARTLLQRIKAEDINPADLVVGVGDLDSKLADALRDAKVAVFGVRKACEVAVTRINAQLALKE